MLSTVQSRIFSPAPASTQTWANGVTHTHEHKTDRYDLPAAAPGVPAHIEMKQRLGGVRSPKLTVTDAAGQVMEAHTEWNGFHRVVVATDSKSGLQTTFDPKNKTVDVTSPVKVSDVKTDLYIQRYRTDVKTQQHVAADGSSRYVSNYTSQNMDVFDPGVAGHAAPHVTHFKDSEKYEETLFKPGQQPTSQAVQVDDKGERKLSAYGQTAVATTGGEFSLTRPDGTSESFPLYYKPA
jgi:hypothetical protein